jgi:hypothetical protein
MEKSTSEETQKRALEQSFDERAESVLAALDAQEKARSPEPPKEPATPGESAAPDDEQKRRERALADDHARLARVFESLLRDSEHDPVVIEGRALDCLYDGLQHSRDSGEQLAEQYRRQSLYLLHEHATFEDGTTGVEAGLMEMLERMQTGRWKVFRHLAEWFQEFRLYHRKNGRVVKLADDLLSASRYAMMMRRFAEPEGGAWGKPIKYPPMGIV